jgi:hypothetical protein
MPNPYRTISGTVTPPPGKSKAWIEVVGYLKDIHDEFVAYTDANGDYLIALDSVNVVMVNGEAMARIKTDFDGYLPDPFEHKLDLSVSSAQNVDFQYLEATAAVEGTLSANGQGIGDVGVWIEDTSVHQGVAHDRTDSAGQYHMDCMAGTYRLGINRDDFIPNYMTPPETLVSVADNETLTVNISLVQADAFIYARITKDQGLPGGTYKIRAWSDEGYGSSYAENDADGYFSIPVTSQGTKYYIKPDLWDDRYDSLPPGYVLEGGDHSVAAQVGDTVFFNMIPKPAGAIYGNLSNSSSFAFEHFEIRLAVVDSTGNPEGKYSREFTDPGAYLVDGIANGEYLIEAVMSLASGEPYGELVKLHADSTGRPILVSIKDNTVGNINFDFTDADTGKPGPPPKGDGQISGTVAYSGSLPPEKIIVLLLEEGSGPEPFTGAPTDQNGNYQFSDLPPGEYTVFAMLDMDGDHLPEAFGENDSLLVIAGADTFRNIDITVQDKPTGNGAISGQITYTGSVFPQAGRITVYAFPYDTALLDSGFDIMENLPFAYPAMISAPGSYTVTGLPDTFYVVVAFAEELIDSTNWENIGWGAHANFSGFEVNFIPVEVSGDTVSGIDIAIMEEKPPAGNGEISGVVTYSGNFTGEPLMVLLINVANNEVEEAAPVDPTSGKYLLDGIGPGIYQVSAVIDTNDDHFSEAFGINDSVLVITDDEVYTGIDISVADKPSGTGSISGTLNYSDSTLPANAEITVFAIPIDTTLPDSERIVEDLSFINSYPTFPSGLGGYTVNGLPEGVYYVVAVAETLYFDSTSMEEDMWEVAAGIYGTWDTTKPEPVFDPVIVGPGEAVNNIDITIYPSEPDISVETPGESELPAVFALSEPAPNPFNPTVAIKYAVPRSAMVSITIYDISGRQVKVLRNEQHTAGFYQAVWHGMSSSGQRIASGIYLCRMQAGNFIKQRKMIMIK